MNAGYTFSLVFFATFLAFTREIPIEGSTLPPEPDIIQEHQHGSHIRPIDKKSESGKYDVSKEKGEDIRTLDRFNHSRMLTLTTTLGYEEWWFLSTRRPLLSFKDFPGRPGVASWKEISPGSAVENRKSRKINKATAASVSSGSFSFSSSYHYLGIIWRVFSMALISLYFCRT